MDDVRNRLDRDLNTAVSRLGHLDGAYDALNPYIDGETVESSTRVFATTINRRVHW